LRIANDVSNLAVQDKNRALHEYLYRSAPTADGSATWIQNYVSQPHGFWIVTGNAFSGMNLAPVDDSLRAHLKLSKEQGLIVTSLEQSSPAFQAGIRQNDVLLKLGDAPLGKLEDLEEALKASGDKPVALSVLRGGSVRELRVQPRIHVTLGPVVPEPPAFWIGVSVAPVEPALRAQLQLPQDHGLLAIDVVKESPAAAAGVRAHDILLKLDGEELANQAKLIELVQARGEKTISLEIIREGKKQVLTISPRRRKAVKISLHIDQPKTFRFDVVHPGAVVPSALQLDPGSLSVTTDHAQLLGRALRDSARKPAGEATADVSKRLDDLAAQVKELKGAIEALTKATRDQK
jgi:membrane-associated protease RseP (regulator of RpoE activity)